MTVVNFIYMIKGGNMSDTHPEILYQVQQTRLHELRERAAMARLAARLTTAWSSQRPQPLRQRRAYLTKIALLLNSPVKKPASSCC